jgi:hypothetical protein
MTSHRSDIPSVSDICADVEHLVYATSRHISAITEQENASMEKSKDQDRGKGAMEQEISPVSDCGAFWVPDCPVGFRSRIALLPVPPVSLRGPLD